jgi:SAM-dependent methyltransferase
VLCIETFEHVFEVRRAFDEVYRILAPGGVFVITSPLNFRIHAYPDDYWRMTPNCLRRMLEPFAARISGFQGYHAFPHTVMGVAIKDQAPADIGSRLETLAQSYRGWLRKTAADQPVGARLRRRFSQIYRSKGERHQIADYFSADFAIDVDHESSNGRARTRTTTAIAS